MNENASDCRNHYSPSIQYHCIYHYGGHKYSTSMSLKQTWKNICSKHFKTHALISAAARNVERIWNFDLKFFLLKNELTWLKFNMLLVNVDLAEFKITRRLELKDNCKSGRKFILTKMQAMQPRIKQQIVPATHVLAKIFEKTFLRFGARPAIVPNMIPIVGIFAKPQSA